MSDPVVLLSTGDVVGPAGGVTDNSMVLFSGTSGKLIKGNNAVVTAAGLALLDDVNAAAQRVTLGLGTAATATLTTSGTDGTIGRILKVGDFGLGAAVQGSYGQDLNAYKTSGFYRVNPGDGTISNSPLGGSGEVILLVTNALDITSQTLWSYGNGAMYTRAGVNENWTPWREIAPINSPAFIGTPTAPTASAGTDTTQLANTAFVKAAVDAAPRLGVGQTWQNVTSQIVNNTNRTNITARPIEVVISGGRTGTPISEVHVDGILLAVWSGAAESDELSITFTLPQGSYYKIVNLPQLVFTVVELR